jgi:C4-dicarboxylate-binding protein DctP
MNKKTAMMFGLVLSAVVLFFACGGDTGSQAQAPAAQAPAAQAPAAAPAAPAVDVQKLRDKAEVVIRIAYTDTGTWPQMENKPQAEHAYGLMFKSVAESTSNGRIFVELFPAGEMGQSKEVCEMVKGGTLEAGIQTGAMAGFYPKIQVFSLPYAFKSDEIAWWVFDNSKFWKDLVADMEKQTGILILGMGQNGTRHFTNSKKPIHSPADMKGMKFRVMQSPIFVEMVNALGANAIPLAHAEIYTSCQTGVVDGQENPVWNIAANRWNEVQKYMTLDGHVWSENMFIINSKIFRDMPKDLRHIVRTASWHGQWADRVSEALGSRITDYEVLASTMEIYSPTSAELDQFKQAVVPVTGWLKKEIGAAPVEGFLAAVREAEKALGY